MIQQQYDNDDGDDGDDGDVLMNKPRGVPPLLVQSLASLSYSTRTRVNISGALQDSSIGRSVGRPVVCCAALCPHARDYLREKKGRGEEEADGCDIVIIVIIIIARWRPSAAAASAAAVSLGRVD